MWRVEAVSTTAVANAEEKSKSTLGVDATIATLLLKNVSSPGRGRWDATPCGRVEGKGTAVAPAVSTTAVANA